MPASEEAGEAIPEVPARDTGESGSAGAGVGALGRRLITIPAVLVATVFAIAAAPLWIALALVVGIFRRRRFAALRLGVMLTVYLVCETIGVVACGVLWVVHLGGARGRVRYLERNRRLQSWWTGALLGCAARVFQFRLVVTGGDVLAAGPYLLFLRHASVADTMLGAALATTAHGVRLRYVLKRELLWDPSIDIVGHRLNNCFVDRGSGDSAREIERVAALADHLGPRDAVLIYPEGTRFTPRKQARVLARLRAAGSPAGRDLAARAAAFKHVLPPRLGGALALLERASGVDVVFCAHTGFEGTATLAHLWNGIVIGRTIRIVCWRVSGADIPPDDLAGWLFEQWARVDDWVDANATEPAEEPS